MHVVVACSCGKKFKAPAEAAGKRAKCPACGQVLVIPAAAPDPQEVAPEPAGETAADDGWGNLLGGSSPSAGGAFGDFGGGPAGGAAPGAPFGAGSFGGGAAGPMLGGPAFGIPPGSAAGSKSRSISPRTMMWLGVAGALLLVGGLGGVWFLTRSDTPVVAQQTPDAAVPAAQPTPDVPPEPGIDAAAVPEVDPAASLPPGADPPPESSDIPEGVATHNLPETPTFPGGPSLPPIFTETGPKIATVKQLKAAHTYGDDRLRHWNAITGLSVSPDGKHAVTVAEDLRVVIWDLEAGAVFKTLAEGQGSVMPEDTHALFSRGGSKLIMHDRTTLYVYEWPSLKLIAKKKTGVKRGVESLDCTSDGNLIIIHFSDLPDDMTVLWKLEGDQLVESKRFTVDADRASISPDGKLFCTYYVLEATVRDINTGEPVWSADTGFSRLPRFNAKSEHAALVTENYVRLYRTRDGEQLAAVEFEEVYQIPDAAISADLSLLAETADNGVSIWNLQKKQRLHSLPTPTTGSMDLHPIHAFSANGKVFVSGNPLGEIRAWNISSGAPIVPGQGERSFCVRQVQFSPDGASLFLLSEDGEIQRVDVATGEVAQSLRPLSAGPVVMDAACATFLAPNNESLALYDVQTGEVIKEFAPAAGWTIRSWYLSPTGDKVAYISGKAEEHSTLTVLAGEGPAQQLETKLWGTGRSDSEARIKGFSADGNKVFVGGNAYDLKKKSEVSFGDFGILEVATAKDRLCAVAMGLTKSSSTPLYCLDGRSGKILGELRRLEVDSDNQSYSSPDEKFGRIMLTADGKWAVAGNNRGQVLMWDCEKATKGNAVRPGRAFAVGPANGQIRAVAVSPNGKYLATANGNGTASLFEIEDGEALN